MARLSHPSSNHQLRFLSIVSVIYFCCGNENPSVNAWKYPHGMGLFVHQGLGVRIVQSCKRKMKQFNNSGSENDDEFNDSDQPPQAPIFFAEDDPDGVPLFDQRATFFGLEPKAELDPLDNGLTFTGPIILFFSIYLTLSLFFAGESEVPAIFEDLTGNQIQ